MNSLPQILYTISYMALPLLLAMVLHEYAHGWVANHYGDPTARLQGRLTINPLAHIDPVGTILLPLICLILPGSFFLGWAKPVPIDPRLLHNPRRDMALVAAAGPGMNLALALVSAIFLAALLRFAQLVQGDQPSELASEHDFITMFLLPVAVMAKYSVIINILLMLFNLLPIPPLDGGRILTSLLPVRPAMMLTRLEPYGMLILMGLIVLDPHLGIIHTITGPLTRGIANSLLSTAMGMSTGGDQ